MGFVLSTNGNETKDFILSIDFEKFETVIITVKGVERPIKKIVITKKGLDKLVKLFNQN